MKKISRKRKCPVLLSGLFFILGALFFPLLLNAGKYSFSGLLPKVTKTPAAVVIKIDTPAPRKKMYIHYRTQGLEDFQVRMMKRDTRGNLYYRLPTGNLYGDSIEYFISHSDKPVPASLFPVFTVVDFSGRESPAIYFQGGGTGSKQGQAASKRGSKFKFPIDVSPALSASLRVHDTKEDPGEAFDANGNIGLSKIISGKKSEFEFESNISYTHLPDEDDNKFNLEDMKVRFESGKHSFSAGDLNINNSKFTAKSLNRRGLRYKMRGKRLTVGSFFINMQQKKGFKGFGPPPGDSHIFGAEAGFKLGKTGKLHGMFMTGLDNLNSETIVSADDENAFRKGTVYSIRGEFKLMKKKLDVKGEFAHSTFGSGPDSDGVEKKSGNAWIAQAKFRKGIITANAKYKKIGRYFSSIGNLFMKNDREGLDSGMRLAIKSFSADLKYRDEKTNINDTVQPMKHSREIKTSFNWIIKNRFTIGGRFSLNNLDYDKSSGEETGSEGMETIQYGTTLGYAAGPNSIIFELGKTESKRFSSDIDGSLSIVLKFGKVLKLSPRFSYQSNKDFTDQTKSKVYNAYIKGTLTFIPKYFLMTFSLSGTSNVYDDGTSSTVTAKGNLKFLMAKLFKKKIKPTLALKCKYKKKKNKKGVKKDDTTFYLQFDISF